MIYARANQIKVTTVASLSVVYLFTPGVAYIKKTKKKVINFKNTHLLHKTNRIRNREKERKKNRKGKKNLKYTKLTKKQTNN